MKIGYKGVAEDLSTFASFRKTVFDVNPETIHTIVSNKELKLCTDTGFHYCNKLKDVFSHYSLNGKNRYFEIEILGEFVDGNNKSITRSFRFIRELTKQDIKNEIKKSAFDDVLEQVRKIQEEYPLSHIAGSIGLYLHGAWNDRWSDSHKDIDIILPYYMDNAQGVQLKKSGNDFDYSVDYNGFKCDIKIDPKQQYSVIEHNGFKYKVSRLENILDAKIRYALGGDQKHQKDIKNMICK